MENRLCLRIARNEKLGLTSQEFFDILSSIPKDESSSLEGCIHEKLRQVLKRKFERKCAIDGYVLNNSVDLQSCSLGSFSNESLAGDLTYHCSFMFDVCRPINKMVIDVKITNKNMVGIIADYVLDNGDTPFMVLIPQSMVEGDEATLKYNECEVGNTISVSIQDHNFRPGQEKITVVAKINTTVGVEES